MKLSQVNIILCFWCFDFLVILMVTNYAKSFCTHSTPLLVGCFGSYFHVYADSDRGMRSESPTPFLKVEYK